MNKKSTSFKMLLRAIIFLFSIYLISLFLLYINQENLIFRPNKLPKDYIFNFNSNFKEYYIPIANKDSLNGLLFKTNQDKKGVILYLHGNSRAINKFGKRHSFYTENGYDIFFFDYRGFGKNHSEIQNEEQLYNDVQSVYNFIKTKYNENQIILLGYSMGSGLAAYLASKNNPKKLILEAPYYSLESLIQEIVPIVPGWILNYKIRTYKFLDKINCPIFIFHGKQDNLIHISHSLKLNTIAPDKSTLYLLDSCTHRQIYRKRTYQKEIKNILK